MILLVGGTGHIGRHIVPALIKAGEQVRVLTRDPEQARNIVGNEVEIVQGDLTNPASITVALAGVDRDCVHSRKFLPTVSKLALKL